MKIFSKFVFVAVSGVFLSCVALAYDACSPGEYLVCDPDPWNGDCTDCGCANCPIGQTSYGTGVVYNCPGMPSGDSGCHDAGYCADYTDECPADVPNAQYRRCKRTAINCGGVTGCTGYELCNIVNGASAGYFIPYDSNVCHMEGSVCYGNTRACSEFDVNVIGETGNWTCRKDRQSGTAYWTVNGDDRFWNTGACSCDGDIDAPSDGCSVGRTDYDLGQSAIGSATAKIPYIQTKRYCKRCAAGYVPDIASAPYTEYTYTAHPRNWFSPNENTSWGSYSCKQVLKPKYSAGCDVNFSSSYQSAVASCQASCPTNMETLVNGAVSQDDCVPDNATVYQDSTGSFKLGTTQCQ